MTAPPVLTAERIDAMLSVMAEVCFESVVEAGRRQKAAEDDEGFERAGRALQGACRNLRQTIALKQRFDREETRKADEARRAADAGRVEAEREHRRAVARHHTRVRRHFERVLWDEYEDDDAQEVFETVDARLSDLADEPEFLEIPAETLIRRLADEIGLGAADAPPAKAAARAPVAAEPAPVATARVEPSRIAAEAPPAAVAAAPIEPPALPAPPERPAAAAPPEPPPQPPPDPPPEPYIPPWERLAPGQRMPGGTGW